MLYRKFPRCSHDVSILGFGAMRLPLAGDQQDPGNINEQLAIEMIRTAIDGGVNYIDTAYPYQNGMSEVVVGKALAGGYRDKVFLATKLPSWLVTNREDMDRFLNEQLARLNTDHIDFISSMGSAAKPGRTSRDWAYLNSLTQPDLTVVYGIRHFLSITRFRSSGDCRCL